jgi:hypothetical protein
MEIFSLQLYKILVEWQNAISSPLKSLSTSPPSGAQISAGLDFMLAMVVSFAILAAPLALRHRGEVGERLVGLFSTAIIVMAWHYPFVWMGGKANLAGTFLAYSYGSGPYMPLTAFAMVLFAAGLPSGILKHATDPAKAQQALKTALKHPETSVGVMMLGFAAFSLVSLWSMFVTFRCLSFVHSLTGWRLIVAILLSMMAAVPIYKIFLRIGRLSHPTTFSVPPLDSVGQLDRPPTLTTGQDALPMINAGMARSVELEAASSGV